MLRESAGIRSRSASRPSDSDSVRARPDREHRRPQLSGQVAGAHFADATQGVEQPLARRQAQREELEHRRKLLLDPRHTPSRGPAQVRIRQHGAEHTEHGRDECRGRGERPHERPGHDNHPSDEDPDDRPRQLPTPEGRDILRPPRLREAAGDGIGPAERGAEAALRRAPTTEPSPSVAGIGAHAVVPPGSVTSRMYGAMRRDRLGAPQRGASETSNATPTPKATPSTTAIGDLRHPNHLRGSGSRPMRIIRR